MKMGGWVVGAALLLSGAPLVAANGKEPVALEPSMPWKIHSTGDFCRLWRSFGTGKQAITVVLDNFDNDEDFRITLAGRPMLAAKRDGSVQLRFGDALPEQSLAFDSGTFARKPAWIVKTAIRIRPDPDGTDLRPITAEDEASVAAIRIGAPLRQPARLDTGPMGEAFALMRDCTEEMIAGWGIDVARHRHLSRPATPVGSPGQWMRGTDYPMSMIRKMQSGIVRFRLMVGEDGAPTACHIQLSTNPEGFDAAVCDALMKRARFKPALDADGKPLPSYYRNSVMFSF